MSEMKSLFDLTAEEHATRAAEYDAHFPTDPLWSKVEYLFRNLWIDYKRGSDRELFIGQYRTEDESVAALDQFLAPLDLFDIHPQIPGRYLAIRPGRQSKKPRIDRVLVPRERLRLAGWTTTIGVECKCSMEKLGPAVSQALDYSWGIFDVAGEQIMLDYVMLWPLLGQYDAISSVMIQNRIGNMFADRNGFHFQANGVNVIHFGQRGLHVNASRNTAGLKTGSR